MVMPRSRSIAEKSVVAAPSWTSPTRRISPVFHSRRSVRVVLPASMWAMMPRLRQWERVWVVVFMVIALIANIEEPHAAVG